MSRNQDRVTTIITVSVALFVILSLVFTFVLALRGQETGAVWGKVFDLVTVLAGGLVGYIAGTQVEKAREEPGPVEDSEPVGEYALVSEPGDEDDDDA